VLRTETKARARALQLLYAWELQGEPAIGEVAHALLTLGRGRVPGGDRAERLAADVVKHHEDLDREIESAVEGWRLERVGAVERNILRLALAELRAGDVPARVVIDEAVRLARWFAGAKAHAFVNGVLDTLARRLGRL
jgi:N utilization substance protein B